MQPWLGRAEAGLLGTMTSEHRLVGIGPTRQRLPIGGQRKARKSKMRSRRDNGYRPRGQKKGRR